MLDAHELVGRLAAGGVTLAIGTARYPPDEPALHVLLQGLAMAADLRAAVHSHRTREGLAAARAQRQLQGRPPKLNARQEHHVVRSYLTGRFTVRELGELFNVARSTVYRAFRRAERAVGSDTTNTLQTR